MNENQVGSSIRKVTVTVVAYSSEETVRLCIDSLLSQDFRPDLYAVSIKIINNNQRIISSEKLKESYPTIEIVNPAANIGYAGAIYRTWHDSDADILVVTNDDLTFRPGWFENLLKPFTDKMVFATTCSIINQGEDEESENGTLNPIGIIIPGVFKNRTKVLFPSGAAFAFRKDEIDPIDFSYFLYYEDVALGLKARLRGFNIVMNPESKADHHHKLSTSQMNKGLLHYFQEKNRLGNIYCFYEGWTFIRLIPYFIADFIIRIIQLITLKRRADGVLRAWFYYIRKTGTTLCKRLDMGKLRKIHDTELLPMMSGKLLPGKDSFSNAINSFFLGYSRLVGLNFAEIDKKHGQ